MKQRFIGVQILRFIAAMLVVVMHTTQAISIHITGRGPDHYWANGSAGVDIFFVISGFVMAMSISNSLANSSDRVSTAWTFLKHRFLRIIPLYWFYTLVKVIFLLVLPSMALRSSLEPAHLTSSFLFIPAMSPWDRIEPLLPVGWTLNFEMFFYLVFALAIALGAPLIKFCLVTFLGIFLAGRYLSSAVPLVFYAQSIVFEFVLGVCLAHAMLHYKKIMPKAGLFFIASGVVLMFGLNWSPSADRLLTWGIAATLLVFGTVVLEPWAAHAPLASRLSFLGDASYSIYLSHTAVVPIGVMVLKRLGMQNAFVIASVVGVVVVVFGCLSYLWLERPMTAFFKRLFFGKTQLTPPPLKT